MAIGFAAICAAGMTAQTQETKTTTKTKTEIKGGTDVTVIGCLERLTNGDFILTEEHDNRRLEPTRYALVGSENFSKHVGERVEIKGKAAANGHGKVAVESKTKTEAEHTKDQEAKTKTEGTVGAFDMPVLGVTSLKTLSSSCRH
jgi:hypothetical protein